MDETRRNFYSVREFCERNSISRSTFYRLVAEGKLRIAKAGRKTLVPALVEAEYCSLIEAA